MPFSHDLPHTAALHILLFGKKHKSAMYIFYFLEKSKKILSSLLFRARVSAREQHESLFHLTNMWKSFVFAVHCIQGYRMHWHGYLELS